ncbi:hypothetical protein [Streptomyces sp. NPDC048155]|uniref:hypothetical protein n=1 Tax=Streptomyces sp. NPDC048155 TaxID=3154818 RepID=UPI0033FA4853
MTLLVHTFVYDEHGGSRLLDNPEDGSDMAGTEVCRTALWGSDAARALGARFLPEPATGDLYVEPEDVDDFLAECALLHRNAAALAGGGGGDRAGLRGGPARPPHPRRPADPDGGRRGPRLVSGGEAPSNAQ